MKTFPVNTVYSSVFTGIALLFALRLFLAGTYLFWRSWLPIGLWLLGGGVGFLVLELDRFVDVYVANPETKLAFYVKDFIKRGKYREAFKLLLQNKHLQPKLTFHSALFQVIWVLLAVFTLTSTTSLFGKAFVLGLGLHLLLDEWADYYKGPDSLKNWLFWQFNRDFNRKDTKIYLWVMTGLITLMFLSIVYS